MRISSGKLLSLRADCYLLWKLMHVVYMRLRQSRSIFLDLTHTWTQLRITFAIQLQELQGCASTSSSYCWSEIMRTSHNRSNYYKYAVKPGHMSEFNLSIRLLWDTLVDRRPALQDARTALTWLPDVWTGKMPIALSAARKTFASALQNR